MVERGVSGSNPGEEKSLPYYGDTLAQSMNALNCGACRCNNLMPKIPQLFRSG